MICKICKNNTIPFAQAQVINKYTVQYFWCNHCGFMQTEEPYWLEEAYVSAINDSDVGLVNRNIVFSRIVRTVLLLFFNSQAKFMDYGGGYGLFVRMMRDAGFDFYRFDQYCENIFVKEFEANLKSGNRYELVTAFEVFEHFTNPLSEIEQIFKYSDSILFSTVLLPVHLPKPDKWWYYGLQHGQHVALYMQKTLLFIANVLGLNLYFGENNFFLLTKKKIPRLLFRLATNYKFSLLLNVFLKSRKRTFLIDDYYKSINKNSEKP